MERKTRNEKACKIYFRCIEHANGDLTKAAERAWKRYDLNWTIDYQDAWYEACREYGTAIGPCSLEQRKRNWRDDA